MNPQLDLKNEPKNDNKAKAETKNKTVVNVNIFAFQLNEACLKQLCTLLKQVEWLLIRHKKQ